MVLDEQILFKLLAVRRHGGVEILEGPGGGKKNTHNLRHMTDVIEDFSALNIEEQCETHARDKLPSLRKSVEFS